MSGVNFYQRGSTSLPSAWQPSSLPLLLEVQSLRLKYIGDDALSSGGLQAPAAAISNLPIPPSSPFYYFEVNILHSPGGVVGIGFQTPDTPLAIFPGWRLQSYGYHGDTGRRYTGDQGLCSLAFGETYATGDIIGALLDRTSKTISFFKNGRPQGVAFNDIHEEQLHPCVGMMVQGSQVVVNFGEQPFRTDAMTILTSLHRLPAASGIIAVAGGRGSSGIVVGSGGGIDGGGGGGGEVGPVAAGIQTALTITRQRFARMDQASQDSMRRIFNELCASGRGSGGVTWEGLRGWLGRNGVAAADEGVFRELFNLADADRSGELGFMACGMVMLVLFTCCTCGSCGRHIVEETLWACRTCCSEFLATPLGSRDGEGWVSFCGGCKAGRPEAARCPAGHTLELVPNGGAGRSSVRGPEEPPITVCDAWAWSLELVTQRCSCCGESHRRMPGYLSLTDGRDRHMMADEKGGWVCEWCAVWQCSFCPKVHHSPETAELGYWARDGFRCAGCRHSAAPAAGACAATGGLQQMAAKARDAGRLQCSTCQPRVRNGTLFRKAPAPALAPAGQGGSGSAAAGVAGTGTQEQLQRIMSAGSGYGAGGLQCMRAAGSYGGGAELAAQSARIAAQLQGIRIANEQMVSQLLPAAYGYGAGGGAAWPQPQYGAQGGGVFLQGLAQHAAQGAVQEVATQAATQALSAGAGGVLAAGCVVQ